MAEEELRRFTEQDLARFNGENGAPVYVAHEGRVFDVTASRYWRGGMHMRRHPAGRDLTAEITAAPHDLSVLDRFPQVGVLVPAGITVRAGPPGTVAGIRPAPSGRSAEEERGLPPGLDGFLARHPFFRRHPHPMTVHFPIVFMIFAPIFTALYLATGYAGFEVTAANSMAAGLLFCLVVIPSGFFTWWVNYGAKAMKPVIIKIVVSLCMFVDGAAALAWRLADPGVISGPSAPSIPWLVLDFLLLPMVVVVAWHGATLTFPLPRGRPRG